MTDRIYYTEPSCRGFDAVVTRTTLHEGRPAVVLDRTAFYPTSGGQPFDRGRLGPTEVLETIDADDDIVHVVAAALPEGMSVRGEIEWSRRFDHMQQHTGQHVLSAAFVRLCDDPTTSFHMGADVSTIDLVREVSAADVECAVDEANRVVWENRPVSIRFVSAEEASRLALRKEPSRTGTLRLIEVSDFDLSACGGTHVAGTGAIGLIAVVGAERLRGGARLTFVCGGRALRQLRLYREAVAGGVRALSVLPHELPAAIERAQAEGRELRKTVSRLQGELAVHVARRLIADAQEQSGVRVVVETIDGWDAPGLKAIAASVTAQSRSVVALLAVTAPGLVVVARSAGVSADANAIVKQLTVRFGGRGGGRPEIAQVGGLSGAPEEIAAFARTALAGVVAT